MEPITTRVYSLKEMGRIQPALQALAVKGFLPVIATYCPTVDGAGFLFVVLVNGPALDEARIIDDKKHDNGNGKTEELEAPEIIPART